MSGCGYFDRGECRSCELIELPYPAQLEHKESALAAHLARFPHARLRPMVASPSTFESRNKSKLVVGGFAHAPFLGVTNADLEVQELAGCPLHHQDIRAVLEWLPSGIAAAGLPPYRIASKKGEMKGVIVRRSSSDGALVVRFVARSKELLGRFERLAELLVERFPSVSIVSLNIQPIPHALLEGAEELPIRGPSLLVERLNDIPISFPARGFSQINSGVAALLYAEAARRISQAAPTLAWDLYCGAGAFTLTAAARHPARYHGIELIEDSVAAARITAEHMKLSGIKFAACSVEEFLTRSPERPECVIVNPPRAGLREPVLSALTRLKPKLLLYSSCNPVTLMRDLGQLAPNYHSLELQPFDMFPHTNHMEVLAALE